MNEEVTLLQIHRLLKRIEDEIGAFATVSFCIDDQSALVFSVDWPCDYHYEFRMPPIMLENDDHFILPKIIQDAKRRYINHVGGSA